MRSHLLDTPAKAAAWEAEQRRQMEEAAEDDGWLVLTLLVAACIVLLFCGMLMAKYGPLPTIEPWPADVPASTIHAPVI